MNTPNTSDTSALQRALSSVRRLWADMEHAHRCLHDVELGAPRR